MEGGLGMGTAANAEEAKTSNKSGISRERGISWNSGGGTVRAAIMGTFLICSKRGRATLRLDHRSPARFARPVPFCCKSGMSPLLREQPCVVDSQLAQAFHGEIELLDAGERADAHAMQRAVVARHLVEAGELDAGGEQRLDAPTRVF